MEALRNQAVSRSTLGFANFFQETDEIVNLNLSVTLRVNLDVNQNFGCSIGVYVLGTNKIYTTESQWRTKKPVFQRQISLIPTTADQQMLRFDLLKMTPTIKPIEEYEVLGDAILSLGQIMINGGVEVTLRGGIGDLRIEVQQNQKGRGVLSMIVAFVDLPKNHWLYKNYPQLLICKKTGDDFVPVYRTEVIKRSQTGQWAPLSVPCRLICDDEVIDNHEIRLIVQDAEYGQPIEALGYADISIQRAGEARNLTLRLIPLNPRIAHVGHIIIRAGTLVDKLTFYGQIQRGLRFGFSCAIDFNAGNRPPRDSKSLHYTSVGQKNCFEASIEAIGTIVEQYSEERQFNAWGFAARQNRSLSHTIQLKNQTSDVLTGTKEILNGYWRIFEHIQFDGPAQILPSTRLALQAIENCLDISKFLVHLILLSSFPVDFTQFIDFLYERRNDPVYIIIIWIGDGDSSKLDDVLNSKSPLQNSDGVEFDRDFVHYARFNEYGFEKIDDLAADMMAPLWEQAVDWIEVALPQ